MGNHAAFDIIYFFIRYFIMWFANCKIATVKTLENGVFILTIKIILNSLLKYTLPSHLTDTLRENDMFHRFHKMMVCPNILSNYIFIKVSKLLLSEAKIFDYFTKGGTVVSISIVTWVIKKRSLYRRENIIKK